MQNDLDLAIAIAQEAGAILQSHFGKTTIDLKGDKNVVTEADFAAEKHIVQRLRETRPEDGVIAEEGTRIAGASGRQWVVDPLDGTNNFAHGFWAFAVSIALVENGAVQLGVVYAPELDQLFTATRGGGAFLNDKPIRVSRTAPLSQAICATGFPYARRTMKRNNLAEFTRIAMEVQGIRRVGAASLDLCWVAAGRFDGYWELHLQPWDVAAGILICTEAGGTFTNDTGGAVDLDVPIVVASNGLIHEELLALLKAPK